MSKIIRRRPRRLRQSPAMRGLVSETRLHRSDLILPMFVADGIDEPREITSMPGVYPVSYTHLTLPTILLV